MHRCRKEALMLAVGVFGKDVAEIVVRSKEHGPKIESLAQTFTRAGGGFFRKLFLAVKAKAEEHPVHEVFKVGPRPPAVPVSRPVDVFKSVFPCPQSHGKLGVSAAGP